MEAGRELDALVAEKVMGNSAEPHWWCGYCQSEKSPVQVTFQETCTLCDSAVNWIDVPAYSTDIAAAWQVVEKILENHFFSMHDCTLNREAAWQVALDANEEDLIVALTAPLAICLAAIKAVGAVGNTQNTMGSSEKTK